jgi:hypothetical protein
MPIKYFLTVFFIGSTALAYSQNATDPVSQKDSVMKDSVVQKGAMEISVQMYYFEQESISFISDFNGVY